MTRERARNKMSKYIKLEDAIHAIAENMAQAANLKEHCNEPTFCAGEFLVEAEMSVKDLPTVEVKDGDLDDAVLLTKDAYSDLCLRASQVNEDCVDRYSVLAELDPSSYEYEVIKELPSVVQSAEPKHGNEDLISRQDALDAIAKFVPYVIDDMSTESYTNGLRDAYNLIYQLPIWESDTE